MKRNTIILKIPYYLFWFLFLYKIDFNIHGFYFLLFMLFAEIAYTIYINHREIMEKEENDSRI